MLRSVRQSAASWRAGSRPAQISASQHADRRQAAGTTFSFALNETAAVAFTFTTNLAGRQAGRRCVAATRKNAKRRSCRRTLSAGVMSFTGHAGTNKLAFQGRLPNGKRLGPGRYALTILATNAAGAHSAPATLSFTIIR